VRTLDPSARPPPPTPSPPPERRLRRVLLYGTSRSVTEGLTGARGLLLATLLGPESFGVWALFRLAMRYAPFAALGVYRGLERQAVQAAPSAASGEDDPGLAARTAVGFLLLVFLPLAAVAGTASFLVRDPQLGLGLRVTSAALATEPLVLYAFIYLRAQGSLRRFAVLEVAQAGLHLALAVALAWRWGLPGAFAGFVAASMGTLAILASRVPVRPALDTLRLRRMLAVGFPLVLTMFTTTLLATADRFVVAAYGGTTLLGVYALAIAVAGLAGMVAWVVRTVIFPDVYRQADVEGAGLAIREHIRKTLLPFARWFPPLLGLGALLIGPAIMLFLPRYADAIAPARIFIFTGATTGFASLGVLGVVAADLQRRLPLWSVAALIINLALSNLAMLSGMGVEGVAAGALLGQAVYSTAVVALAAGAAGAPRPVLLPLKALAPLALCVFAVYGLGLAFPGTDPVSVAASVGLYLLILSPLAPRLLADLRRLR
jgi:O-antigen/teichoic acid export membrane protein